MTLFLWKKSYEIKVSEIDMQHRRLVTLINELSDAMMVKQGHRAVPHVLEELVEYVQLHFTTEEQLMREMAFPEVDEHCREHLNFTNKVLALRKKYSQDHMLDSSEVLNFLCDWLRNHIIVNDKEIGEYMRRVEMGLE